MIGRGQEYMRGERSPRVREVVQDGKITRVKPCSQVVVKEPVVGGDEPDPVQRKVHTCHLKNDGVVIRTSDCRER